MYSNNGSTVAKYYYVVVVAVVGKEVLSEATVYPYPSRKRAGEQVLR
jgi:hypothetical protein